MQDIYALQPACCSCNCVCKAFPDAQRPLGTKSHTGKRFDTYGACPAKQQLHLSYSPGQLAYTLQACSALGCRMAYFEGPG
jgi:hypothetical protein